MIQNASCALLQPLQEGALKVCNRIALSPMTRGRAGSDGLANSIMEEYYVQRGTAGLVITEGTQVSEQARGWIGAPGIWTNEQTEAWKSLVAGFKKKTNDKTPIFMQLWHPGRASHSDFHENGSLPIAPSPIALTGQIHTPKGKKPYETPHVLTIPEISRVVQEFKRAAQNAFTAGFDGVEIHSANGYLLDEFLQSKINQRTDKYGGSFENRFRLLKEVLEAVTFVFPKNRVGVRLGPNGVYNDTGSLDYRESFTYYFQQLDKYGLAYLHVIDGLAFGFHGHGEPITLQEIRQHFHGMLIGNCGYDFKTANEAIEAGHADMISFGRPFLSNPDLVERFTNGWPLNEPASTSVWYSSGPEGYVDFPKYIHAS